MKSHKPNKLVKLVKTDEQEENAFIVFCSIIIAGILLVVSIIMHYL